MRVTDRRPDVSLSYGYACHLILGFEGKGKASLSTDNSVTGRVQVVYASERRFSSILNHTLNRYPPIGHTAELIWLLQENDKRERRKIK